MTAARRPPRPRHGDAARTSSSGSCSSSRGANVPLDDLPGWMSTIAQGLPLTHGIEAARRLADGASFASVGGLVAAEALVGLLWGSVGVRDDPRARVAEPASTRRWSGHEQRLRVFLIGLRFHVKGLTHVRLLPAHVGVHAAARRDGRLLHVQGGRQAWDAASTRRSARPSTGSGRRRCSARAARSSGSAGRGRWSCSSPRRRRSSCVVLPLTLATSAIGDLLADLDPALGPVRRSGSRSTSSSRSRSWSRCRRRSSASACSGFLFASTFVLYRNANALSNMLEWPVLLVTGMLVPLSLLPAWAHPIAWVLAPTWGVQAISRGGARRNALAGHRHDHLARRSPTSRSGRCSSATSRSPHASRRPSR